MITQNDKAHRMLRVLNVERRLAVDAGNYPAAKSLAAAISLPLDCLARLYDAVVARERAPA